MATGQIGNALVRTFRQQDGSIITAMTRTKNNKIITEIFNEAGESITKRTKQFVTSNEGDNVTTKRISDVVVDLFPKWNAKLNFKQLITRFYNKSTKETAENLETYITSNNSTYKWYSASRAGKSDVVTKLYNTAGEVIDIKSAPAGNITQQASKALR